MALYVDPFKQLNGYVNSLPAGLKKTRLEYVTNRAQAFWSGIEWDPNCDGARDYINRAAADGGKWAVVIAYSVPFRDAGQYSAGGAGSYDAYRTWWDKMISAVGNRQVVMVFEPDALGLASELIAQKGQAAGQERFDLMRAAVLKFRQNCLNAKIYVDSSSWKSPLEQANLLRGVGITNAHGFVTNVSGFDPDHQIVPLAQQVINELRTDFPQCRFIYDTSRNGNPVKQDGWLWANPAHRRFGKDPQYLDDLSVQGCDGWLWLKAPGESDGNNHPQAPVAGALFITYLYNDNVGDNVDVGGNETDKVFISSGMCQRPPAIAAAGGADITQPNVSIVSPNAGNVNGVVPLTAFATDNVGVVGVQFKKDGVNLGAEVTVGSGGNYVLNWNTVAEVNGSFTITAVARDAANNTRTSVGVVYVVANGVANPTGARAFHIKMFNP